MHVRQLDVSQSDKKSAAIFFRTMLEFYDVSKSHALDMFARDGALTVSHYAGHVPQLDLWELGAEHHAALVDYGPTDIKIGCSYLHMARCQKQYGLIVVDTPQGLHSDYEGAVHAEHFDVVRNMGKMLADRALVVLYVNREPYNKEIIGEHGYDEYKEFDFTKWMHQRAGFYCVDDPGHITEEEALTAYRYQLLHQHLQVRSTLIVPCYSDVPGKEPYAFRVALEVERS